MTARCCSFCCTSNPRRCAARTLAKALRVVKPGGRLVIVDYLRTLEPFALDLWRHEIGEWFPESSPVCSLQKTTSFGGLYQLLALTKAAA